MPSCAQCKHSQVDKHPRPGMPTGRICRRYPPTVNSIPVMAPPDVRNPQGGLSIANQCIFPTVSDEWWCGEYASAPVPLKGVG